MFGIQFIKVQPTMYMLHYKKGKLVKEGAGLSFFYFAPTSSLVSIPLASVDVPFVFKEVTSDFQEVSVQGQVTYRISDPKKLSQMLNFTLDKTGQRYGSDDPQKLSQRVVNRVQVIMRGELQSLDLKAALATTDGLVKKIRGGLTQSEVLTSHGIEVIDLSILAIKPNPETSRALEAERREQLLKEADEAIYSRRNSSVEQERAIKENELNTEIAVENKRRQIRETQMEAERTIQEKQRIIAEEQMIGKIDLEKKNAELVDLTSENNKKEAETRAYAITAAMKAYSNVDPKILQALANVGMESNQLIALAFRDIAENAGKIGQLNISPDLLKELLKTK